MPYQSKLFPRVDPNRIQKLPQRLCEKLWAVLVLWATAVSKTNPIKSYNPVKVFQQAIVVLKEQAEPTPKPMAKNDRS
jgi:hypothetical protein